MRKTILLLIIIPLILATTCNAQPDSLWSRTYGGAGDDACYSLIQTADGGFALGGVTVSFGSGMSDMWIVKTNADGDSLWSHTFGGRFSESCGSLIETIDGSYVFAGNTSSFGSGEYDMWMIKTNADGDSLWSRTFGGARSDGCHSMLQTEDGGYILAGSTRSYGHRLFEGRRYFDMWMIKTNADGDSLWSRTFGGELSDRCLSIIRTEDGGYVLAGYTESFGAGSSDFWMVKTNADGDSLWSRTFGGERQDFCNSIVQTEDGGFALGGTTLSFSVGYNDLWIVKTNANGDSLWSRTYGEIHRSANCNSLIQTEDGCIVASGYYGIDVLLLKINSEGDSLWSENYGRGREREINSCYTAIQIEDGSFVLGGSHGIDVDQKDMFLIKTSPDPVNVPDITKPLIVEDLVLFPTYPNPFNSTTTIRYQLPTSGQLSLAVYNPTGQRMTTLFEGFATAGVHSINLIADELPTGLYFVRLNASNQVFTQKVMLIK